MQEEKKLGGAKRAGPSGPHSGLRCGAERVGAQDLRTQILCQDGTRVYGQDQQLLSKE